MQNIQWVHNKYYMSNVLKRYSRGILLQVKGGLFWSSQLRSDSSQNSKAGGWTSEEGTKVLKLARWGWLRYGTSSRGTIRLESNQIRFFLWWSGGRLDLVRGGQRCSRETILRCQGTWSENWHRDSLKKVKHTLSQVMSKMGDEVDDEDYEEVERTSVSQDRVTATLCTEELFLSTQYV